MRLSPRQTCFRIGLENLHTGLRRAALPELVRECFSGTCFASGEQHAQQDREVKRKYEAGGSRAEKVDPGLASDVCGGLLLRDTMESAEAKNKFQAIDRHDLPSGKAAASIFGRGGVSAWAGESGHKDCAVDHEKIGIGGGQPESSANTGIRHRKLHDAKALSLWSSHAFQSIEVFPERAIS